LAEPTTTEPNPRRPWAPAVCPRVIGATDDGRGIELCGKPTPCPNHNEIAPGCPHGIPTPASCLECMEDGPVTRPARWTKIGGPFTASYPGECPAGDPIDIGDVVQRWDRDQVSRYAHVDCGRPA
jgi:hypothetical protein